MADQPSTDSTLPSDLSTLDDAALNSLAAKIQQSASDLQDKAATDDTALAQLEQLANDYLTVTAEMQTREEAISQRQERVTQAIAEINGQGTAAPADAAGAGAGDGAPVAQAVEEPVALAVEDESLEAAADGEELATEPAETEAEPAVVEEPEELAAGADSEDAEGEVAPVTAELAVDEHPPVTQEGVLPSDEVTVTSDSQEAAVADPSTTVQTPDAAVAALSAARPTGAAPLMSEGTVQMRPLAALVDQGTVDSTRSGAELDRHEVAELMVAKHHQIIRGGKSNMAYEPIIVARAKADFSDEETLTMAMDHEANYSVIRQVNAKAQGLVASGGTCAPLTPNYDVFNVAAPMNPIEAALPTIAAPRGGVRYIQPPSWTEAQAGVRLTTEAEDAAGYSNETPAGPTAPKPCVHLACRAIVECVVDAVSACVTFGNLQYRTFAEQVEVFLEHLAVAQAYTKEVAYLDAIDAGSTAVFYTPPYSATRGSVFTLALAAHAYRKRNRMAWDAPLDFLAPDTMVPLLKVDAVNDLHMGLGFLDVDEATLAAEIFNRLNINVTFYYDYATSYGSTNALQQAQAAGELNGFPTDLRGYLFAPGTWIRLDGGTLDVGIVRDSTLNSQNNLQMFSEEFVQVCKVGVESVRLDITLCPDGTGPAPITALVCAS
jgi:hypothetical protein